MGALVQHLGTGCVEAEHLMLVVLADPIVHSTSEAGSPLALLSAGITCPKRCRPRDGIRRRFLRTGTMQSQWHCGEGQKRRLVTEGDHVDEIHKTRRNGIERELLAFL